MNNHPRLNSHATTCQADRQSAGNSYSFAFASPLGLNSLRNSFTKFVFITVFTFSLALSASAVLHASTSKNWYEVATSKVAPLQVTTSPTPSVTVTVTPTPEPTISIEPGTYDTTLEMGKTYTATYTVTNTDSQDIDVTSCYIRGTNYTRTQTKSAINVLTFNMNSTAYTGLVDFGDFMGVSITPKVRLAPTGTTTITITYKLSSEVGNGDQVWTAAACVYDYPATTGTVEGYGGVSSNIVTTATLPTTLKNVYFTFWTIRYGNYASPSKLRTGDNISLKNYDPKKIQLTAISLYDYTTRGNQCYSRVWKSSTQIYAKTCNLLPAGRKYAFIFTFRDIATGVTVKKYFVVNTIRAGVVTL